ncbi:MAG: HEAT repeat domain-containing protein [Candidatus Omnitrophica bacterium]|nr:HEAT repeat domain-containing protein [Candidatus Omnitrophota bacterium]
MGKHILRSKIITSLFIMLFTLGQLSGLTGSAYGLSVQPLTSPLSEKAENENVIKTYVVSRVLPALRSSGTSSEEELNAALSTQTLYSATPGETRRIQVLKIQPFNEGLYTIFLTVNGEFFKASVSISSGDIIVSAAHLDVDTFPASSTLEIDPRAKRIASKYRGRQSISVDQTDLPILSASLLDLLTAAGHTGLFRDIPGANAYLRKASQHAHDQEPFMSWTGHDITLESMLAAVMDNRPDLGNDISSLCFAIGRVFYSMRSNPVVKKEADRKSELFYRLAHQIRPDDFTYHEAWIWSLYHSKNKQAARTEFASLMRVPSLSPKQKRIIKSHLAYDHFNEAFAIIRHMTHDRSNFYGNLSHAEELLSQLDALLPTMEIMGYPRVMSVKGMGYCLLARLMKLDLSSRHKFAGTAVKSGDARSLVLRIFSNLDKSAGWLTRAVVTADTIQATHTDVDERQLEHAANMLSEGVEQAYPTMSFCWQEITSGNMSFPDPEDISHISDALDGWTLNNISALRAQATSAIHRHKKDVSKLKLWVKAHRKAYTRARAFLWDRTTPFSDDTDALADMRRAIALSLERDIPDLCDTPEGTEQMMASIADATVAYIVEAAGLDDVGLAALNIMRGLDTPDRTLGRIIELLPLRFREEKDNVLKHKIRNVAAFLDITITKDRPAPREAPAPVEAGDDILSAIDTETLAHLRKESATDTQKTLLSFMTSKDWRFRLFATVSLGDTGARNPNVKPALETATKDAHYLVRYAAHTSLAGMKEPGHDLFMTIYRAIAKGDPATLATLYKTRNASTRSTIMAGTSESSPSVRITCLRALPPSSRDRESFAVINRALSDPDPDVRHAAADIVASVNTLKQKKLEELFAPDGKTSLMVRLARLRSAYVHIHPWYDRLNNGNRAIADDAAASLEWLEEYLPAICSRAAELMADPSAWQKSLKDFSSHYYEASSYLDELEEKTSSLSEHISQIIASRISLLNKQVSASRENLVKVRVERLTDDFLILDNLLESMNSLTDPGNEEGYLSISAFDDLGLEVSTRLENIDLYALALETYKDILSTIDEGQTEALRISLLLDDFQILDRYMNTLEDFRNDFLLAEAFNYKCFDEITDDNVLRFCADIPARTAFLRSLRETIDTEKAELESFKQNARAMGGPDAAIEQASQEILALIIADMGASPQGSLNIIDWGTNIHLSPLTSGSIDSFLSGVKKKLETARAIKILGIRAAATLAPLEALRGFFPDSTLDENEAEIRGISREMEEAFDTLGEFNPMESDFESRVIETELRIADLEARLSGIETSLLSQRLALVTKQVKPLVSLISIWADSWLDPSFRPSDLQQIRTTTKELSSLMSESPSSAEGIRKLSSRMIARMNKLISSVDQMSQAYGVQFFNPRRDIVLNAFRRNTLDFIRSSIEAAEGAEMRHEGFNLPIVHIVVPYFDEQGLIADAECVAFYNSPSELGAISFTTAKVAEPPFHLNEDAVSIVSGMLDALGDGPDTSPVFGLLADLDRQKRVHNAMITSNDPNFAGIVLPFEYVTGMFTRSLQHYAALMNMSDTSGISPSVPVPLDKVFARFAGEGLLASEREVPFYAEDLLAKLIEKHTALETRESDGEADEYDTLVKEHLSTVITAYISWLNRYKSGDNSTRAQFLRSMLTLLNKTSSGAYPMPGEDTEPPQPILTMDEDHAGSVNLFRFYPPVRDYSGVYYDPKHMQFRAADTELGKKGLLLAKALSMSQDSFMSALLGDPFDTLRDKLSDTDAPWLKEFNETFSLLAGDNTIHISVVKDLPVNSMRSGKTILFNEDFIDFILENIWTDDAAAFVLGERVMHEFGHIAHRGRGLTRLEEEVRQIEADVLLYERTVLNNPENAEMIGKFTDIMVKSGGYEKKFSRMFNSSQLFRNIAHWAELIEKGVDRDKVRAEIRVFAKKILSDMIIVPSDTNLFPAAPEQSFSLSLALANNYAGRLMESDVTLLNNVDTLPQRDLARTRRVLISSSLIPGCQKNMIYDINRASRKAYDNGFTRDLVEIKPLSYLHNQHSDENTDIVMLLEKEDTLMFSTREKHLVFERNAASPVLINGLVAAGRAVLYNDLNALRNIIALLSGMDADDLPSATELGRYMENNREEFARALTITLPGISLASRDIEELNRNLMHLLQFA